MAELAREDRQAQYYFITVWEPRDPNYMRPLSLWRINGLGDGERWDGCQWIPNNKVFEAYGFGGDTDYQRVVSSRLADVLRYFGVPNAEELAGAAAYCREEAVWEDGTESSEDELWAPVDRWIRRGKKRARKSG